MQVVRDYPPLFDEIDRRFRVRGKGVIFAWGDRIYNPRGVDIPPSLIAHEAVHGARQGRDIVGWWRRYIEDGEFRLAEEIPAHQAEYAVLIRDANRQARRGACREVARRLASPLYGGLLSRQTAERLLREEN